MRKLHYLLVLIIIVFLTGCDKDENKINDSDVPAGYVDLGLPSGTKWKSSDENGNGTGLYDFDEAVSIFSNQLPSKEQLEELITCCTWTWQNNNSCKVTGKNGNSITLSAMGFRNCYGNVYYVGYMGSYWSSTPSSSESAWDLYLNSSDQGLSRSTRCDGRSIRLVYN